VSDQPAWLADRIAFHTIRLGVLSKLPDAAPVVCPMCSAADAAATIHCGCGGTTTVSDARTFHIAELAILNADGVQRP
jgi:hypothetical protein